jgi:hypothetical protein
MRSILAGVAQMVEQLIRNQQVNGSIPLAGSIISKGFRKVISAIPFFIGSQSENILIGTNFISLLTLLPQTSKILNFSVSR